jgi:hypothetical protein
LLEYAERWGILFEKLGGTRMMGKVLGRLLVSVPAEQSARELAEALGASAGSISGATRALLQAGMIERVGIPGRRSAYFRVRPGMWGDLLEHRMSFGATMGELAGEGLRMVRDREGGDANAERADSLTDAKLRLEEIRSYCCYVDRELPGFIERWRQAWEAEKKERYQ